MRIIKDYMNNDALRHELNVLTETVFGFSFEGWVVNGYNQGDYIPCSLEEDGKIISNVSANIMKFVQNGEFKSYIQIGTVMTDSCHRKKGLARGLMERVIKEYEGKCDGIYLFSDLGALDFYRKIGFQEKMQYTYTLKRRPSPDTEGEGFMPVSPDDGETKKKYCEYVKKSIPCSAFEQINKYGLQMFYTSHLENVYYSKDLDCFMVMEREDGNVEIQSIVSQRYIPLERITEEIHMEYIDLKLGFTPLKEERHLFECSAYDGGDDYRLFCRGGQLDSIEKEKLYFPVLSHA